LKQEIVSQIPLKRLGNVSSICAALDFLLDQEASYFTGQSLNINGGMF
jgi:3-oxoacyl-[acyl-carrier protein] reductase